MSSELNLFIEKLENSDFYGAHEVLEERWRVEQNPKLKKMLKGLINSAVALEIYRRKRGSPQKPLNYFYEIAALFASDPYCNEELANAFDAAFRAMSKAELTLQTPSP